VKILFLGGTQFVGRHMAAHAVERGHEVTLFTRGKTNPGVIAGAEEIHGDRDGGLDGLAGLGFDRVVDVSGYVPRVVRQSAELLVGATDHYTFVSTVSVYGDLSSPGINEDAPLGTLPDETIEDITGETYGPLKVLCENAVHETYGDRCTIVRPGFVVGPLDYTDRFSYWCTRASRGGDMLAPDDPHRPIQFVDARDLASFTVGLTERPTHGYFNATGPGGASYLGPVPRGLRGGGRGGGEARVGARGLPARPKGRLQHGGTALHARGHPWSRDGRLRPCARRGTEVQAARLHDRRHPRVDAHGGAPTVGGDVARARSGNTGCLASFSELWKLR
jgi:nucleoside-diphosphate-sugar epimerase